MLHRCIRRKDTGQWIDVLFTVDGDEFSVPELPHRTDIAAALGLLPTELEAVDSTQDRRIPPLLALPVAAPSPAEATEARVRELLATPFAALTPREVAELGSLSAHIH